MVEQIRSNRHKILLGVIAYLALVAATTALVIAFMFSRYNSDWVWALLFVYIILSACIVYFATFSGMRLALWLLGATPVYHKGFQSVRDEVGNIATASGQPVPELMLIDSSTCNAMSLKRGERRIVFFTRGLWEELDGDELTAVMAHEMAHLHNGDAALNELILSFSGIFLLVRGLIERFSGSGKGEVYEGNYVEALIKATGAILLGFLILAKLLIVNPVVSGVSKSKFVIVMVAFPFAVVNLLWAVLIGGVMSRTINPRREMLADELSLKWTMYPEGLARALMDTSAHATMYKFRPLRSLFFVPCHFLDRQPSPGERIAYLEETLHMKIGEDKA